MKYREILLEQVKSQPFFNKKALCQLSEQFGLKNTTVDSYISRSLKHKDIYTLKKGLYVSADFYNANKGDISYLFYLANILRPPSYVSSWSALQHYNLTTEAIYTITSITLKITRIYKTKIGNFSFQSIKNELFSDFSSAKGKFDFFIASPAKALFDLLYFKTRQFRGLRYDDVKTLVEGLRIEIDEMGKGEQEDFYSMIKSCIKNE